MSQPITVSQITNYIKSLLENAEPLQNFTLCGELSNYKMHQSGHHYFTLKDENAVISAVMFAGSASKLRFRPESGMKVIVSGRVSLFPKSGQYQIYVNSMQPDGVGALYIAFEQLKEKLFKEGLFDKSLKKALPTYPQKIALITSPTGAAVRDILRILKKRWPFCEVIVCPVKVQGDDAATQIAQMIDYASKNSIADLIIAGRGGGSIEDLWAFNEEIVARAIARCEIPIISAVGHEPDITIADYVADLRAATPSNAAELAVPDCTERIIWVNGAFSRMALSEKRKIELMAQRLSTAAKKKIMQNPGEYINELRMSAGLSQERMFTAAREIISNKRKKFIASASTLNAISPLAVLARGYGFVTKDEHIIRESKSLKAGDKIKIKLGQGGADCVVEKVNLK